MRACGEREKDAIFVISVETRSGMADEHAVATAQSRHRRRWKDVLDHGDSLQAPLPARCVGRSHDALGLDGVGHGYTPPYRPECSLKP